MNFEIPLHIYGLLKQDGIGTRMLIFQKQGERGNNGKNHTLLAECQYVTPFPHKGNSGEQKKPVYI